MNIELMIRELLVANDLRWAIPGDGAAKEALLNTLRTISDPVDFSDDYYEAEKEYLEVQMRSKTMIQIDKIMEQLGQGIYLHQGDITAIEADAIVNAANEKLLGCFVPGHHCIDNAIQMAAGSGLRHACHQLMEAQGHDEPVGYAKVTGGYNLPAKYVVHTVGPNLNRGDDMTLDEVETKLKNCYLSCLRAVEGYDDVHNIVFCSISTGVYGVPIELASEIALKTIAAYLIEAPHHLNRVVIDVFSQSDYNQYKEQAIKLKLC